MATEMEDSATNTPSETTIIIVVVILGVLACVVYRVQADMLERKQEEKRRQLREKMTVKARDNWTLEG